MALSGAQEQEKRKERLMCPLCRFLWHDIDSFEYTEHGAPLVNVNNEVVQGPYQDPWLQPLVSLPNPELVKEKRPIPPQHRSLTRSWVQVRVIFTDLLLSFLFFLNILLHVLFHFH